MSAWFLAGVPDKIILPWLQKSIPTKSDDVEDPPENVELTPAQLEFWNYLEQFNHLPENPSVAAIAVYNTRGVVPEFRYLKASSTSVLGDTLGIFAHRELFVKRYPWIQSLMGRYSIEIPISAQRFSGSAKEICENYKNLIRASHKCKDDPRDERTFVTNFLEGLLVVDFLYARGTPQDKQEGLEVINSVFQVNYIDHPFQKTLELDLLAPASRDIGWPTMAAYPELIWGLTPALVCRGFFEHSPADKANFSKWLLQTKGIHEMDNAIEQDLQRGIIHNEQVRVGLLSYSIYSAHSHDMGRPKDAPWLDVIQILFKRLFPTDHVVQYQQYLTLLNAAYPNTKS